MKRGDLVLGAAVVLVGVAVFLGTRTFPEMPGGRPGPALFPRILSGLFVLFGLLLIVRSRQAVPGAVVAFPRIAVLKAATVLFAIVAYIALVDRVGFLITGSALLVGLMLLLGVRPRAALPIGIAVVVLNILLFERLLRVPLPRGVLGM